MKNILVAIILFFCLTQAYSQDVENVKYTKEMIFRGIAVSAVGNVKPFVDRDFPKEKVMELVKEQFKAPFQDAPSKAYDLLEAKKTNEEVIDILYNDFMNLDDEVISKFLNSVPKKSLSD